MEARSSIKDGILKHILKDISKKHTITSLSEELKATRMGIWKTLKKLESEKQIILEQIGKGKTSTYEIILNWKNPIVEKTLSTLLLKDSLDQEKWRYTFKELENKVLFIILYGSVLYSPKQANDIDLLVVINEKHFKEIDKTLSKTQLTQSKKIHTIDLTKKSLKQELKNKNKAYLEALKKGIILFGQEEFIKFIKEISK